MVSGGGSVFHLLFSFSSWVGSGLTLLVTFLVVNYGLDGIKRCNLWIITILVAILVVLFLQLLFDSGGRIIFSFAEAEGKDECWLLGALLYTSYNLILAMVVLIPMGNNARGIKSLYYGGLLGGAGILMLVLIISLIILTFVSQLGRIELPMLQAASYYSSTYFYLYGLVLWLAMLTTAFATLYGLTKRVGDYLGLSYHQAIILSLLFVIPSLKLGFVSLVKLLYPFFGYLGLILILMIIISVLKRKI